MCVCVYFYIVDKVYNKKKLNYFIRNKVCNKINNCNEYTDIDR